jgi:hypothetical protein
MVLSLSTTVHHQYAIRNGKGYPQGPMPTFSLSLGGNTYTSSSGSGKTTYLNAGGNYTYYIFTSITGASGGTTTLATGTQYSTTTTPVFYVSKSDNYTFTANAYLNGVAGSTVNYTVYLAYLNLTNTPSITGSWTTNSTAGITAQLVNLQGTYSYYTLSTTGAHGATTTLPSTSQTLTSQNFYVSNGDQFTFNITLYDTGSGSTITGYTYSFSQYVGFINVTLSGVTKTYSGTVTYGGYLYYVWNFQGPTTNVINYTNYAPASFVCEFFLMAAGGGGGNVLGTGYVCGGGGGGGGQVIWPITNNLSYTSDSVTITVAGQSGGGVAGANTTFQSTNAGLLYTAVGGAAGPTFTGPGGYNGNAGGNAGGSGAGMCSQPSTSSLGSGATGGSGNAAGGNADYNGGTSYYATNGGGGGGGSGSVGGGASITGPSSAYVFTSGSGGQGYKMPSSTYALANYSFGGNTLFNFYWAGGGGGGGSTANGYPGLCNGGAGGRGGGGGGAVPSSKLGTNGAGGTNSPNGGGSGTSSSASLGTGGSAGVNSGGGGGGGASTDANTITGRGGAGGRGLAFFAIRFIT